MREFLDRSGEHGRNGGIMDGVVRRLNVMCDGGYFTSSTP